MGSHTQHPDEVLQAAATLWEQLGLPLFSVDGYLDGSFRQYTVPEVLQVAAERIRTQRAQARSELGVAA